MKKDNIWVVLKLCTIILSVLFTSCVTNDNIPQTNSADSFLEDEEFTNRDYSNICENERKYHKSDEGLIDSDEIIRQEEDRAVLRVMFERTAMHVYHFTVSQNGILDVSLGMLAPMFSDDLVEVLREVYASASVQLTRTELDHLLEMVEEIERISEPFEYPIQTTGWSFWLNYNDIVNNLHYSGRPPIVNVNFIDKLLMLSPIEKPEYWNDYLDYLNQMGWVVGYRPPFEPEEDFD